MIKDIFKAVKKRKNIVVAAGLGMAIIFLLYSFFMPPAYKASVQISIGKGNVTYLNDSAASWQKYIDRQCEIIKSQDMLKKVVDRLHLRLDRKFAVKNPNRVLRKLIRAEHVSGTSFIDIAVYMKNPELAASIAKALAKEYADSIQEHKFALTKEALLWLKETSDLSTEIQESEKELSDFMRKNKSDLLDEELNRTQRSLDSLSAQKSNTEVDLTKVQNDLKILETLLKKEDKSVIFRILGNDPAISAMKGQIAEKQKKITDLKRVYEDNHPEIVRLNKEIKVINDNMEMQIKNAIEDYKADLNSLDSLEKQQDLDKEISAKKEELVKLEDLKNRLDTMSAGLERKRRLYDEILNMLKEGRFQLVEVNGTALLDNEALTTPVKPSFATYPTLGFLTGIVFGCGIAVFLERSPQKE